MAGYQSNSGGYQQPQQGYQQGGQYQPQPRKIPQLGRGRASKVDKSKPLRNPRQDGSDPRPDFRGIVNVDGHIVEISMWYQPPKEWNGKLLPESWSLNAVTCHPNTGLAPPRPQQPQPQQGGYASQPQGYQQQLPMHQPQGAPGALQAGGYAGGSYPSHPHQNAAPAPTGGPGSGNYGGYQPAPGYQPPPQQGHQQPQAPQAPQQQRPQAPQYGQPGATFKGDDEIPF